MRRKRKETPLRAIVYLSVKGKENNIDNKEEKQLNYITEYANAHNIKIVKIMHRSILSDMVVNKHFSKMVSMVSRKKADVILLSKVAGISKDIEDAYKKIGSVIQAGGCIITVDEGELKLPIRMNREIK